MVNLGSVSSRLSSSRSFLSPALLTHGTPFTPLQGQVVVADGAIAAELNPAGRPSTAFIEAIPDTRNARPFNEYQYTPPQRSASKTAISKSNKYSQNLAEPPPLQPPPINSLNGRPVGLLHYMEGAFKRPSISAPISNLPNPPVVINKPENDNTKDMALVDVVVDTAGFWVTEKYIYKTNEDLTDTLIFAISDFISQWGLKQWVANLLDGAGVTDKSTTNESMLVDYLSTLVGVGAAYKIIDMAVGREKPSKELFVGITGSYVIYKAYKKLGGAY